LEPVKPPNPRPNLNNSHIAKGDFSIKKCLDLPSLSSSEDIRPHHKSENTTTVNIIKIPSYNSNRQVCVLEKESKNLAKVEIRKQKAAGATVPDKTVIKGKIIGFLWELKKQGLKESSIETYRHYLTLLNKYGADLLDPESVKENIALTSWSPKTKAIAISAYSKFLEVNGHTWNPPKCKSIRKLPFIPLESELDQLISGAYKKLATFLQLLKETGMRSGEVWHVKWIDIDFKNGALTLNEPEKYGHPRMFKISSTLIAMINTLPRKNENIFDGNLRSFRRIYLKYRKRMATKLQNQQLKRITFHTFRQWKTSTEYAKTKDILHVMKLLGHRAIKTTLIYTQLIHFESDEFHSSTAKTVKEATQLVEAGFEYVCTYNDVMLFRKRK
jgi:integrase